MQSLNIKADSPIRILTTGFGHDVRRLLVKRKAYNWLMSFSTKKLEIAIEPKGVIYLTDAATEVLTKFDPA